MHLIHNEQDIDINLVKLDETSPNPNKMTNIQMQGLKESLIQFGFVEPIIIDQDGVLADGEHRYLACKSLGYGSIKAIRLQLTETERRLLRQAKNKLKGKHDIQKDVDDLQALISESDLDLVASLTGQTSESLEDFINQMTKNDDIIVDVVEHERGLPTKDKLFDIKCPQCGASFNIDDSKNNGS